MQQLDLCLVLPDDEHELLVLPASALDGPSLWRDGLPGTWLGGASPPMADVVSLTM